MTPYEFTNDQRRYFGLTLVEDTWDRELLSDTITVYFNKNELVKVLNYGWGYLEYDTDISTLDRAVLLPKSPRGKEQKFTIPRVLKIKGCGVQFSGSFKGGGIHVYDNNRNRFFIKSFSEDGEIKTYSDINNWVSNYIRQLPPTYFVWLDQQLSQKRLNVVVQEGDVFAFQIGHGEYGFARVLLDVSKERRKEDILRPELNMIHTRSLIVAPYAFYSDTIKLNIDKLIQLNTLPPFYMFDLGVYRGEMPIIRNIPLSEHDRQIPFPIDNATYLTMRYTKSDIEAFIATNGLANSQMICLDE